MSEYEEEVLKYCSTRILPEGYKIDADLRRKLIALVEDVAVNYNEYRSSSDWKLKAMREKRVRFRIASGEVDEMIGQACINEEYLTEEEKIFLLKSSLRRKVVADRHMYEKIGFVFSPQVPYQLCMGYLLEHGPLTEEYLLYLVTEDRRSPIESFIHNFQILVNDRNLNDLVKILYYLSLPRIAAMRGGSQLLQKATSIILNSEAIAKENRVNVFEFLRDPDAFHTIGNAIRVMAEAADPDEVSIHPFLDDLFESIAEMPEEVVSGFIANFGNVLDCDFDCVRGTVCKWYISKLPTHEEQAEVVVQLLKHVVAVKSGGDRNIKMSAYEVLYSMSADLDEAFVRKMLEQGAHSNNCDIRARCYKYLLLLFDDATYVESCLNDTSKKVQETVVRTVLSGTKMDTSTRLRLYRIIKKRGLKLNKRQESRLKNLIERGG